MKKVIGVGVVVLGLVAGGYIGILKYREAQLVAAVSPLVKNGSIRINDAMLVELDPGNITYGEAIKKLDENTSEIDKKIIELQSLDASSAPGMQLAAVEYLRAGQSLTRSLTGLTRKSMALSSARTRSADEVAELSSASGYALDYAIKSARRANEAFKQAGIEYHEQFPAVCGAAKKLKEQREKFLKSGATEDVINLANLDKLVNTCEKDDAKDKADTKS